MASKQKLSKNIMNTTICRQKIKLPLSPHQNWVCYSLCKKQATTVSIFSNQRLLIFDQNQGRIYYVNDVDGCPFKTLEKVPKPKNQAPIINFTVIKRQAENKKVLLIMFNKKVGKQLKYIEWRFLMQSQELAESWQNLMKQKKIQRFAKILGIDPKDKSKIQQMQNTFNFMLSSNLNDLNRQNERINNKQVLQEHKNQLKKKQMDKQRQRQSRRQQQLKDQKKRQQRLNIQNSKRQKNLRESGQKHIILKQNFEQKPNQANDNNNKIQGSHINNSKSQRILIDWNLQFISQHNYQTIEKFQKDCLNKFKQLKIEKIYEKIYNQDPIIVSKDLINIYITKSQSEVATILRQQFTNYEYITNICLQDTPIGVPLCCLIEDRDLLLMFKAKFPPNTKIIDLHKLEQNNPYSLTVNGLFKQLQEQTRISSQSAKNHSRILNLSLQYDFNRGRPRIFIDELQHYLPHYPVVATKKSFPSLTQFTHNQLVRPQLILDNFNQPFSNSQKQGGFTQFLYFCVQKQLKQLAQLLINQEVIICSYLDLEELMSCYGLNMNMVGPLHYLIQIKTKQQSLKYLKVILTTIKCAQLIYKNYVRPILLKSSRPCNQIQGILRTFCQGKSALYQHAWKQVSNLYKKTYNVLLSIYQVDGGTFLSSLIYLLKASYDIQKLDKNLTIFEHKNIIKQGFIKQIELSVQSYRGPVNKKQAEKQKNIMQICGKVSINRVKQLLKQIELKNMNINLINKTLFSQRNIMRFKTYLSEHISPFQQEFRDASQYAFQLVNAQPLNIYNYRVTKNYIKHSKHQIFKEIIENSQNQNKKMSQKFIQFCQNFKASLKFWLGKQHPFISEIQDQISQFYCQFYGNWFKAVQNIKKSIATWQKSCGSFNYHIAKKQSRLAYILLKEGEKKQALQYFGKANEYFEDYCSKYMRQHIQILQQMSQVQLSLGNLENSLKYAYKSIDKLQQLAISSEQTTFDLNETNRYLFCSYQKIFRVYRIQTEVQNMKQIAFNVGSQLNNEKNTQIFDGMLKICFISVLYLTGLSFNGLEKLKKIQQLEYKLRRENGGNKSKSRQKLMKISDQVLLVEKLKQKFLYIDTAADAVSKRNKQGKSSQDILQFKEFIKCVFDCIGGATVISVVQEVQSIINQKLYANS